MHDFVHGGLERDEADRTFFARFGQAVHEFAAIEWFMGAIALDNAQVGALDLLVGREAIGALQTDAAAADAGTITRLAGVDDFVVTKAALGTTHSVGGVSNTPLVVA